MVDDPQADFPRIIDEEGYAAQPRDFAFVRVSLADARSLAARRKPLGFRSDEDWRVCVAELHDALERAGDAGADVRLKGSAAEFFSRNPKKRFPQSEEEHAELAGDQREARRRWRTSPFSGSAILPSRCFWDARFRLGLDSEPSDYDVQIASDALAALVRRAYPTGQDPGGRSIISSSGGQFRQEFVREELPSLSEWSTRWTALLEWQVNIALFSGAGPASPISRFSDRDWVLSL